MCNIAFITGITGQDGSYLSELLLSKNYKVYGIVRRTSTIYTTTRIDHIRDKIHLEYGDLSDIHCISNILNNIIKDNNELEVLEIYNLAAQSHVAISFEIPEYTTDIDALGVLRLLEIVRNIHNEFKGTNKTVKFYQAGTSELFGDNNETPQSINTRFNPVSPYAASKLYSYHLTKIYREGYGIYCVNGILFNHESSRRGSNFVTMKIIKAAKKIYSGEQECVELGNLYSKRDWGHAIDYVNGMWKMMQQEGIPKDYVLATGNTYTIKTFIEKTFSKFNIKIYWKGENLNEIGYDQNNIPRIYVRKKYFRPCEVNILKGDPTPAKLELGWEQNYDLDSIIDEMIENT